MVPLILDLDSQVAGSSHDACAQGSPILVMDEPVASLDLGNQITVLRAVRRLAIAGRTCLMSTHNPDHAFLLADAVALLSHGNWSATASRRM
jgi:iron complex transport system ATP-binding protein